MTRAETWNARGGLEVRRSRTSRTPPALPVDDPLRFPGDPGVGKYWVGWADGPNIAGMTNGQPTTARTYVTNPPDISMYRTYAGDGGVSPTLLDKSINAGCIADQTFHGAGGSYTLAQLASGAGDAQIDADAATCDARAPWPIWLNMWHEPEDNVATAADQTSYRAATRRYVTRFRTAGVTNVAWQPVFMNPWTFLSDSGRDWRKWHPDWDPISGWNSNVTMDMMGLDTYDPMPPSGSGTTGGNRSFASMMDTARAKIEVAGVPEWPYTLPEFGMSNLATPTPNWLTWGTAARDYAIANNVIAFFYWDNSTDIGRWSFGPVRAGGDPSYAFDPSGIKRQGWNVIVNAASNWAQV